jgi:hypothetical protein
VGDAGVAREVALELAHVVGEALGGARVAAQGAHREGVGAGGATEAEVDAVGVQCGEGAKLLGHDEGRVVGQHHAARAEADALRVGGDVGDEHRGRRRGDAVDVVVLGVPHAAIAQGLGGLGEAHRAFEALAGCLPLADVGEVEDGQGN